MDTERVTKEFTQYIEKKSDSDEHLFVRAAKDVINLQIDAGIDIPTDGEVRRENYIHYHCRYLEGFDFKNLEHRVLRDGAYETNLPAVRNKIKHNGSSYSVHDFKSSQSVSSAPVKFTLPGPLTIMDTTADCFYDDFARQVDDASSFGMEGIERCFHGVPKDVTKIIHMCCGYPDHIDDEDYKKADPESYHLLAKEVDELKIDQVSIEDAHCQNNLELLEKFKKKSVIFGAIAIASSRLESEEEIIDRINSALLHIDRERLVIAPDCGLGLLTPEN